MKCYNFKVYFLWLHSVLPMATRCTEHHPTCDVAITLNHETKFLTCQQLSGETLYKPLKGSITWMMVNLQ